MLTQDMIVILYLLDAATQYVCNFPYFSEQYSIRMRPKIVSTPNRKQSGYF